MPVLRSAGIIFFRNTPKGRRYLIVRSSKHIPARGEYWDIPKGELEAKEKGIEAAKREAKEEVGIENFSLVEGFKFTAQYFSRRGGKSMPKYVAIFLAEAGSEDIKLSWEHDKHEWAPLDEAIKKTTTMREAIKKADEFLNKSS